MNKKKVCYMIGVGILAAALLGGCGEKKDTTQETIKTTVSGETEAKESEAGQTEAGQKESSQGEGGQTETESQAKEEEAAQRKLPAFTAKDLDGNEITEELFAQKDLTVLNVWGTFCGPCISEMPELGEWAKELPDNVQIVGLVSDILGEFTGEDDSERIELAKEIMETAGAEFTNILPSADLLGLLMEVVGVPTTYFIDGEGNIVGEPIVGANVPGYKAFVEDYLSSL